MQGGGQQGPHGGQQGPQHGPQGPQQEPHHDPLQPKPQLKQDGPQPQQLPPQETEKPMPKPKPHEPSHQAEAGRAVARASATASRPRYFRMGAPLRDGASTGRRRRVPLLVSVCMGNRVKRGSGLASRCTVPHAGPGGGKPGAVCPGNSEHSAFSRARAADRENPPGLPQVAESVRPANTPTRQTVHRRPLCSN
jgi:hypothetical protein